MNKILTFPHPALRKKCAPVKEIGKEERVLVEDLKRGLRESKSGLALAAPQVGGEKRIFVAKENIFHPFLQEGSKKEFDVFVNPEISTVFGERVYPAYLSDDGEKERFLEGCLSFPNIYGTVRRWLKIEVAWFVPEREGELRRREAVLEGLAAIVFQHEFDHLEGILFIDRIKEEGGEIYKIGEDGKRKKIDLDKLLNKEVEGVRV